VLPVDANELRQLANEFLIPFFSGAEIETEAVASNQQEACVAFVNPCRIAFKINAADAYRLLLRRSQPFETIDYEVGTVRSVVEAFVQVVRGIEPGLNQPYRADLLSSLQRRVVGKAIADPAFEPVFLQTIDQLDRWSSRLYEGHPITASVGFVPDDKHKSVLLTDYWKKDFSSVLTNGHDTLLIANEEGYVLDHTALPMPSQSPPYAPYRLAPLATWAANCRVVVALNRVGEILVLRDQTLLFARRSGAWHFLTPEAVVTQLRRPDDVKLRQAILETALDVSFARSGGCIGVVTSTHRNTWKKVVVHSDDYLAPATSVKAKVFARTISDRPFQQLDRRLRQELVAIDGATVIDHHGNLLALGAILQIPGGSEGGGRLAAAKALSTKGMGIKISQDGGIRCYHDNKDVPVVALM
jgi:hypothetical protein